MAVQGQFKVNQFSLILVPLSRGGPFRISGWTWYLQKTKLFGSGLPKLGNHDEIIVRFDTVYQSVTDGHTVWYELTDISAVAMPALVMHSLLCYRAGKN